ncbi:MAG: excisionase family DNA-binding protein [Thermoanaerobaculia bacterium]
MIAQKDPLTPKELAIELRVVPKTVYRWIADGKLKAVRTPGGSFRIWRRDVEVLNTKEA